MYALCVSRDMYNPHNPVMLHKYCQNFQEAQRYGQSLEFSAFLLLLILLAYFLSANKLNFFFPCTFKI